MTANPFVPRHRFRRRPQRGFTVVELMVTVALVATLSALAAPSLRQLIATQRVRTAASALNESLWLARSEAVKRNTNVTFKFNKGTVTDWDVVEGLTGVGTSLHHQDGYPAITATTAPPGDDVLFTFNPYGRLTSGTGWVKLEVASAGAFRFVCVSSTGRASVQELAC